jgi:hypothetical protein
MVCSRSDCGPGPLNHSGGARGKHQGGQRYTKTGLELKARNFHSSAAGAGRAGGNKQLTWQSPGPVAQRKVQPHRRGRRPGGGQAASYLMATTR